MVAVCADRTATHAFVATDQTRLDAWLAGGVKATSVTPTTVSANINAGASNSSCDFLFEQPDLAQESHALFMQGKEVLIFENGPGVCVGDQFVRVEMTGPEGPIAKPLGKVAHIMCTMRQRSRETLVLSEVR